MYEITTLSPERATYLEWLMQTPSERFPKTKVEFAKHIGVHVKTLYGWERNTAFRNEWNKRVDIIQESPERRAFLLDLVFEDAKTGDKRAIELFFRLTNQIQPPTIKIERNDVPTTELTDEELAALLSESAQEALEARMAEIK
jgi:hypothetical protein